MSLQVQKLDTVSVAILPEAYHQRTEALEAAQFVVKVESKFAFEMAVEALKSLKAIEKAVEASRKAVKAPVLDLGRSIDAAAETFLASVKTESERLTKLATAWEAEQRRISAEAERQRQEEEAKAKRAELERLRALEWERQQAEKAAAAARSEEERLAAEERRKQAEASAAAVTEQAAVREASAPVVVAAPKTAGTVVRESWTFEVLDLKAFAAAHPELVEITVKRSAVLEKIREGCRQLAHARIYQETKLGVRV